MHSASAARSARADAVDRAPRLLVAVHEPRLPLLSVRRFQTEFDGSAMAMAGAAAATRAFLDMDNDHRSPEARSLLAVGNQWCQTSFEQDSRLYQAIWDAEGLENLAGHLVIVWSDPFAQHPLGVRAAAREIFDWLRASADEAWAAQ